MIDPPDVTDQYITCNFQSYDLAWISKDDWPPIQVWQTNILPENLKVKIQPVHGERWMNPHPGMTNQYLI